MASIFSGGAGRRAAQASNSVLAKGLDHAQNQLINAKDAAAGYLNQNPGIYQNAYQNARGLLDSAYGDAKSQTGDLSSLYQPFYDTGVKANTAYNNALGMNGADGYAQAMQQFRTGPGYQFQMDQGLDAINRTAAMRGGLASGNNSVDLMRYAQGQADQSWQQNLSNLGNQASMGMQAGNNIAQAKQGLAQMAMTYGGQGAELAQNYGTQLAGVNNALAGNETGLGNQLSNNTINTFNQMAQNTGQGMMAGQTAAANRFGALMGGVQSGLGFLGMM